MKNATSLYKVEENILLFESYKGIFLFDIGYNQAKLLQTINNIQIFESYNTI